MPDRRKHRGPHPEDATLFAPQTVQRLRQAVTDLSWLLSREYTMPAALKLVGDRFALNQRQRLAVMRSACADSALARRWASEVPVEQLGNRVLVVDGFNVLTTVEAALAGGVVLIGRDGVYRDMASVHGTWRQVEETPPALKLVGTALHGARVARTLWLLDQPVSNSGRLKQRIEAIAAEQDWDWQVRLLPNPDPVLSESSDLVATADSEILNRCQNWFALARYVVEQHVQRAWRVDLRGDAEG